MNAQNSSQLGQQLYNNGMNQNEINQQMMGNMEQMNQQMNQFQYIPQFMQQNQYQGQQNQMQHMNNLPQQEQQQQQQQQQVNNTQFNQSYSPYLQTLKTIQNQQQQQLEIQMQQQKFQQQMFLQNNDVDQSLNEKFDEFKNEIMQSDKDPNFFRNNSLPLARIKKIMKSDEDVKMISAEAPVLFSKACEIFIIELTHRAWSNTEESKRRTLQRNDISNCIANTDIFDFLIDLIPREEIKKLQLYQQQRNNYQMLNKQFENINQYENFNMQNINMLDIKNSMDNYINNNLLQNPNQINNFKNLENNDENNQTNQ